MFTSSLALSVGIFLVMSHVSVQNETTALTQPQKGNFTVLSQGSLAEQVATTTNEFTGYDDHRGSGR
ncbi:MAG TPA: hypothetical protein V6D10_17035 [Trichocoleus sp.]|jgi:hypothetical protein